MIYDDDYWRNVANPDIKRPAVSVVIPVYNRAKIIGRTIESVLNQTVQDFEIIVVDDASKDGTEQAVRAIKDERIVYIRHDVNRGGSAARNTGIRHAHSELIAFLDSDDEWFSEKLAKQLEVMNRKGLFLGLVYTGMNIVEENGTVLQKWMPSHKGHFLNELLIKNWLGTLSTVLVKKEFLDRVKGLDETLKSCQDWDLYVRLNKICPFFYVDECLVQYHVNKRDASRISNNKKSIISGHRVMEEKFRTDYTAMPSYYKITYYENRIHVHASVGDVPAVVKFSFLAFFLAKDRKYLLEIPRRLGRCLKVKIKGKGGY